MVFQLFGIVLFICAPLLVSILISVDTYENKKTAYQCYALTAIASLLTEGIVFYSVLKNNPFALLHKILYKEESYQMITRCFLSLEISFLLSIVVSILVLRLFITIQSSKRKKINIQSKTTKKKQASVILLFSIVLIPVMCGIYYGNTGTSKIRLQEICRKYVNNEEKETYVVLRNIGTYPCELKGLYLSTNKQQEQKYRFANEVIFPGNDLKIDIPYEESVSIKKKGGTVLYLTDSFDKEVDYVNLPEIPDNYSYQKKEKEWTLVSLEDTDKEIIVNKPIFSAESGFYKDSFELTIACADKEQIYYTLDGSDPTTASIKYSKPIKVYDKSPEDNIYRSIKNIRYDYLAHHFEGEVPVDKAFIIKAIAADSMGNISDVVTQTYFIDKNQYKNKKVISLICNPEDLFGDDGIYVTGKEYEDWYKKYQENNQIKDEVPIPNFMKRGIEWERPAQLQFFNNGINCNDQMVGIRLQGNSSRREYLKRFAIYSRKKYSGKNVFNYNLLGAKETHSISLRSGFDNALSYKLADGRSVPSLQTVPVVVFINGELWYETFMQDKYSNTLFANLYDLNKNNIEILKIGTWAREDKEIQKQYKKVIDELIETDVSKDDNYKELCKAYNIQSYIDFMCINTYLGNTDFSDYQNTCIWRTKINEFSPEGDCRWNWALNDMDLNRKWNLGDNKYSKTSEINTFADTGFSGVPAVNDPSTVFSSLKASPIFCEQFVLTFMDLINTNFESHHIENILQEMGKDLSYDDFFFRDRENYIIKYMAEEFGLKGFEETVSICSNHPEFGDVQLNTIIPKLSSGEWKGKYYTDYPVTLTALEKDGHSFVGWEIDGEKKLDKTISVMIRKGGTKINAIFK